MSPCSGTSLTPTRTTGSGCSSTRSRSVCSDSSSPVPAGAYCGRGESKTRRPAPGEPYRGEEQDYRIGRDPVARVSREQQAAGGKGGPDPQGGHPRAEHLVTRQLKCSQHGGNSDRPPPEQGGHVHIGPPAGRLQLEAVVLAPVDVEVPNRVEPDQAARGQGVVTYPPFAAGAHGPVEGD